jgi:hypothetical protein
VGGLGSGRHQWSHRDTTADLQFFGIKDWVARGLIRPGKTFPLIWTDKDGHHEASIDIQIQKVSSVHPALVGLLPSGSSVPDHLQAVLEYSVRRGPDDVRPITDIIVLVQSPRGFAGQSWWFRCPGCSRRVADLYPRGDYFRCRRCCGVGYESQRETRQARGLKKSARIKQQLGGTGEHGERVPDRPKGMHRRTYERLLEQVAEAERPWNERMTAGLDRLLGLLPQT